VCNQKRNKLSDTVGRRGKKEALGIILGKGSSILQKGSQRQHQQRALEAAVCKCPIQKKRETSSWAKLVKKRSRSQRPKPTEKIRRRAAL